MFIFRIFGNSFLSTSPKEKVVINLSQGESGFINQTGWLRGLIVLGLEGAILPLNHFRHQSEPM